VRQDRLKCLGGDLSPEPCHDLSISIALLSSGRFVILAGGEAKATYISSWIILCVFFGTPFLIIRERCAEMTHTSRRKVIDAYSPLALEGSASIAVVLYSVYRIIASRSELACTQSSSSFVRSSGSSITCVSSKDGEGVSKRPVGTHYVCRVGNLQVRYTVRSDFAIIPP
jgi:hypothetical protein